MERGVDTNVLIAAFRSRTGAAAEVVRLIRRRELTMVVTVALFIEYEAVLTRPEHLARAGITAAEAETALDVLADRAAPTTGVNLMMSLSLLLLFVVLLSFIGSISALCLNILGAKAKWAASAGATGSIVSLFLLGLTFDREDDQTAAKLDTLRQEMCAEQTGTIKPPSREPSKSGLAEGSVGERGSGQIAGAASTEELEARRRAEVAKAEEIAAREHAKEARAGEEEAHQRADVASREEATARERAELAKTEQAEAQQRAELARREEAHARHRADAARAEEMEARQQAELARAAEVEWRKRADAAKADADAATRKPATPVIIRGGRKSLAVSPTPTR
jgi:flagellar biosynthesis GTPase FlhF